MTETAPSTTKRPSIATCLWAAALASIAGFLAIYLTLGPREETATSKTPTTAASPDGKQSRAHGEMAAFVYKNPPADLKELSFNDADEQPVKLADFKGRVVLLNLWATWCAPCVRELPALDRLQRDLGGDKFQVVALSLDRGGAKASMEFLAKHKIGNLKLYMDPKMKSKDALSVIGMPTTLLIDDSGREVGRLVGPAEWDSADAKKLIEAVLD